MKQYTLTQIRDFISCPQFGDHKYGKWGAIRLEVRETIFYLLKIIDSEDEMIKGLLDKEAIINKAIEYIEDNVSVYAFNNKRLPHWEMNDDEIKELLDILKGSDIKNGI